MLSVAVFAIAALASRATPMTKPLLGAAVGVQNRTECSDCAAVRSVVDVHASTFGFDEPGPPELGQVMAAVSPYLVDQRQLCGRPHSQQR